MLTLPLKLPVTAKQASVVSEAGNIQAICSSAIRDKNLVPAVVNHLSTLMALVQEQYKEAFEKQMAAYSSILEYFKDPDSNWMALVVVRYSDDLRLLASLADQKLQTADNQLLRESLVTLTNGFTAVAKERKPEHLSFPEYFPVSKKVALFAVTNVLFKIYFKLNTLPLCNKLINAIEGQPHAMTKSPMEQAIMNNLTSFPVADVVTYKFYIGKLKMFEDRYEEARECLRFALKNTPSGEMKNRQLILTSLVPVELCLGVMPADAVSSVYGLHAYVQLGRATALGDVRTFESVMKDNQITFIRLGVYLVLEQVKALCYRSLFKRIYTLTGQTRLRLSLFKAALNWLGEDIDLDEVECIIANLIFQRKIKGYISHEKRTLIISKDVPFPLSSV